MDLLENREKSYKHEQNRRDRSQHSMKKPVMMNNAVDSSERLAVKTISALPICTSVEGLKTQVWGSGCWSDEKQAVTNEVTRLSTSSRGDEWDLCLFSVSFPLVCANAPTLCRLFADCRAEALQENLTCLRSTCMCFNKNNSHVTFPKRRKTLGIVAASMLISSCLFFHTDPALWALWAFFLYLPYYSYNIYISIWPWIFIICWSLLLFVPPCGKYLWHQAERFIYLTFID